MTRAEDRGNPPAGGTRTKERPWQTPGDGGVGASVAPPRRVTGEGYGRGSAPQARVGTDAKMGAPGVEVEGRPPRPPHGPLFGEPEVVARGSGRGVA